MWLHSVPYKEVLREVSLFAAALSPRAEEESAPAANPDSGTGKIPSVGSIKVMVLKSWLAVNPFFAGRIVPSFLVISAGLSV